MDGEEGRCHRLGHRGDYRADRASTVPALWTQCDQILVDEHGTLQEYLTKKQLDGSALRIDPFGQDSLGYRYYYFGDFRLYQDGPLRLLASSAQAPSVPVVPSAQRARRDAEASTGRRSTDAERVDDEETDDGASSDTGSSAAGVRPVNIGPSLDPYADSTTSWTAVCVTSSDWQWFLEQLRGSRHGDELRLLGALEQLIPDTVERIKQYERRVQRARLFDLLPRKRSSRIQALESKKEEEQRMVRILAEEEAIVAATSEHKAAGPPSSAASQPQIKSELQHMHEMEQQRLRAQELDRERRFRERERRKEELRRREEARELARLVRQTARSQSVLPAEAADDDGAADGKGGDGYDAAAGAGPTADGSSARRTKVLAMAHMRAQITPDGPKRQRHSDGQPAGESDASIKRRRRTSVPTPTKPAGASAAWPVRCAAP